MIHYVAIGLTLIGCTNTGPYEYAPLRGAIQKAVIDVEDGRPPNVITDQRTLAALETFVDNHRNDFYRSTDVLSTYINVSLVMKDGSNIVFGIGSGGIIRDNPARDHHEFPELTRIGTDSRRDYTNLCYLSLPANQRTACY
jgi:hypothetical protein